MTAPPTAVTTTEQDEEQINIVASPSFLASLRPPPLPLWAIAPVSSTVNAANYGVTSAQVISRTGFSAARTATSFAFSAARAVTGPVSAAVDHAFGLTAPGATNSGAGPLAQGSAAALHAVEALALGGLAVGSSVTNAVLGGAQSVSSALSGVYGNDEALRCLAAFIQLVRREWTTSLPTDPYPDLGLSRWSLLAVARAASTYCVLQGVTAEWDGDQIAGELEELNLSTWGRERPDEEEGDVFWEVTNEELLQTGEELIQATIAGPDERRDGSPDETERQQIKRFSKMVGGSYGGIGVVFFGVKVPSAISAATSTPLTPEALAQLDRKEDEESLGAAIRGQRSPSPPGGETVASELDHYEPAREQQEGAESEFSASVDLGQEFGLSKTPPEKPFDVWGLLTGTHDEAVLQSLAGVDVWSPEADNDSSADEDDDDMVSHADRQAKRVARKAQHEARLRQEAKGRRPPRYFIITDHPNRSVLLILRGTLTIDDLATDLACEPAPFDDSLYWDPEGTPEPPPPTAAGVKARYQVHGGMMEMATALGGPEGPVTRTVAKALKRNEGYDLHLVGHSLGAGVATLLGLMWANPTTSLSSRRSGLPEGRRVQVYGFATPCVTDAELSRRCRKLVHSFIYSMDAVTRFSLGHIRDIRSAAAWLCFANNNPEEASENILSRIIAFKRGKLDHDPAAKAEEASWLLALRSSLSANQQFADLFPPGDILWLTRPDDLTLPSDDATRAQGSLRLFRITGRPDIVFRTMLFTKTMLSSHLPNQYMKVIETAL